MKERISQIQIINVGKHTDELNHVLFEAVPLADALNPEEIEGLYGHMKEKQPETFWEESARQAVRALHSPEN